MAISDRINREQLNIHQFQEAPEAKFKLPFDVERDIDESSKRTFFDDMERTRKQSLFNYAGYATIFKRLWPEQALNLSETEKDALIDILIQLKRQFGGAKAKNIQKLITTYPELHKKLSLKDFNNCLEQAREWSDAENYFAYAQDLFYLKVVNPQDNYPLTKKEINELTAEISNFEQEGDWREYVIAGAFLKILAPNHAIEITDEIWDILRKDIEEWTEFQKFEMASYMKILAAQRVEVTAPGVMEFQMYPPEDLNQSTPPMPETRKF